jgi:hypothetical protein
MMPDMCRRYIINSPKFIANLNANGWTNEYALERCIQPDFRIKTLLTQLQPQFQIFNNDEHAINLNNVALILLSGFG